MSCIIVFSLIVLFLSVINKSIVVSFPCGAFYRFRNEKFSYTLTTALLRIPYSDPSPQVGGNVNSLPKIKKVSTICDQYYQVLGSIPDF